MALRRDVDDIGIPGMDPNAADVVRLLETPMRPRFSIVRRSIDTVTVVGAVAKVRLTGANPNDLRTTRRDRDVTNRCGAFTIEDRLEGCAVVDRAPKPARSGADEKAVGIARSHSESDHAPALTRRANLAEREVAGDRVESRLRDRLGGYRQEDDGDERTAPTNCMHCSIHISQDTVYK